MLKQRYFSGDRCPKKDCDGILKRVYRSYEDEQKKIHWSHFIECNKCRRIWEKLD